MTDPASYQLGYSDAKAGKPSAYPVAQAQVTPTPVAAPVTPAPKPAIAVGLAKIQLDPIWAKANAGDAASISQLANLPLADYYFAATATATRAGLTVKAPAAATLTFPVPIPNTNQPGNCWVALAPGLNLDGFTLTRKVGIYFSPRAPGCRLANTILPGAYNVVLTGNNGILMGTAGTYENIGVLSPTDDTGMYFDQCAGGVAVDATITNCLFPHGSASQMAIRIDSSVRAKPRIVINGGVYSNQEFGVPTARKAAIAARRAIVEINGAIVYGQIGCGQVFPDNDPVLIADLKAAGISTLIPGFYCEATIVNCDLTMDPGGGNNAPAVIMYNRGTKGASTGCNGRNLGPYPHRLPIGTASDGTSSSLTQSFTANAPSVGAAGGVAGMILPQAGQAGYTKLATESGTRWFA